MKDNTNSINVALWILKFRSHILLSNLTCHWKGAGGVAFASEVFKFGGREKALSQQIEGRNKTLS